MGSLESASKGLGSSCQVSSTSFSRHWNWFFQDTVFLAGFPPRFPFRKAVLIANFALPLSSSLAFFWQWITFQISVLEQKLYFNPFTYIFTIPFSSLGYCASSCFSMNSSFPVGCRSCYDCFGSSHFIVQWDSSMKIRDLLLAVPLDACWHFFPLLVTGWVAISSSLEPASSVFVAISPTSGSVS